MAVMPSRTRGVNSSYLKKPLEIATSGTFVPLRDPVAEVLRRAVICRDGVSRQVAEEVIGIAAEGRP
jgi:hypothetical protein